MTAYRCPQLIPQFFFLEKNQHQQLLDDLDNETRLFGLHRHDNPRDLDSLMKRPVLAASYRKNKNPKFSAMDIIDIKKENHVEILIYGGYFPNKEVQENFTERINSTLMRYHARATSLAETSGHP